MENLFCVYKHTTPNGKVYIGITNQNPERRWRGNGSGYKENAHFWNAIQKYGWENIKHEIISQWLSKDAACKMEIELIKEHKSHDMKFGYNQSLGGEHGNHGEATKQKLSESLRSLWENDDYRRAMVAAHIGKPAKSGWRQSKEAREKMSKAAKERMRDPEYRKRLSESAKRRTNCEEMRERAKKAWADPETREKYSKAKIGNRNRAKIVLCVETGEIFKSVSDAALSCGLTRDAIGRVCRGEGKKSGGKHWKYVE